MSKKPGRLKRIVLSKNMLIVVASTLVAAALGFFQVRPERVRRINAIMAFDMDQVTFNTMRSMIRDTEKQRDKTGLARREYNALVSSGVLERKLGSSFAVRGQDLLEPLARKSGFEIGRVTEHSQLPLPHPQPPPKQLFKRQLINVEGVGSYTQIVAFVREIEAALPLTALASIRITGSAQTPERHKSTLVLEWPVRDGGK